MSRVKTIGRLVKTVVNRRETIETLLGDINPEALKHLSEGKFLISEDLLRNEVMGLEKASEAVKSLDCRPEGVIVLAQGNFRGVALETQVCLNIRELILTESTQRLVVRVTLDKSDGNTFLRDLLVKALIRILIPRALKDCHLENLTDYDAAKKLVTVRLNELPEVESLLKPKILGLPQSVPLRWLGIKKAVHVDKGIEVHLEVSPALKQLMKSGQSILSASN
jgi:hypothetical protein